MDIARKLDEIFANKGNDIGDICEGIMSAHSNDLDLNYCYMKYSICNYKKDYYRIGEHIACKICTYKRGKK